MPIYHRLGELPRKRHVAFRRKEAHADSSGWEGAGVYREQLIGNKGFTGPSSLLYHLNRPTAVKSVGVLKQQRYERDGDPTLRMRHLRTMRLPKGGSPTLDRTPLLYNNDVALLFCQPDKPDEHFYRNGAADEYLFVCEGQGVLESQFGELPFVAGDQLMIPRGLLYRLRLDAAVAPKLLCIESRGDIHWPRRYRTELGQLVEGAPFSERDIKRPGTLVTHEEKGEFEVIVKKDAVFNRVVVDHHPWDVVGWDGYYYPWSFNIHDFEPITGKIHQPPPIHQLVEGRNWVLCNFCPRPYDFHDQAIPAPYNHANVMTDEVLFYASSEFMSRKGIEYGSITLHPDGLPHGPHPGRYEASIGKAQTDELAVMLDTFNPLHVTKEALEIEDREYFKSWIEG